MNYSPLIIYFTNLFTRSSASGSLVLCVLRCCQFCRLVGGKEIILLIAYIVALAHALVRVSGYKLTVNRFYTDILRRILTILRVVYNMYIHLLLNSLLLLLIKHKCVHYHLGTPMFFCL